MYYRRKVALFLFFASVIVSACTGQPGGTSVVSGFELDRYLGTWYEIARLDHRFERGLTDVTADYTLRDDGGVRVVNRGLSTKTDEWDEAIGKAYLIDSPEVGRLKVSFFGPVLRRVQHPRVRYRELPVCACRGARSFLPLDPGALSGLV